MRNPIFFIALLLLSISDASAQIAHRKNIGERTQIDAKRSASVLEDKEALLRSREFIRMDSTYYVGYMVEGIYKAQHATDFFGFQNSIEPLQKAKTLLENDYSNELRLRTSDLSSLYYMYATQMDYQQIADELFGCYMNTERYAEAYEMTRSVLAYNLQMEYYFTGYTSLTWIINKLRTRTRADYDFLKNSVQENLELAQRYLDTALQRNTENSILNAEALPTLYGANLMSVYHYKALLYAYNLEIDSADKYYNILKEQPYYSHNNRGNYLMTKGLFRQADIEYRNESNLYNQVTDKHLKEYIYYQSMIDIYKQETGTAIHKLKEIIAASGSTPGFGWYNIALARAYLYDGDLVKSQRAISKAEKFKEIHIGTSLGSEHYSFSLNIVKYYQAKSRLEWLKKRNKKYWWNIGIWWNLIRYNWEIYLLEYQLVSEIAENPEREEVLYQVFATESIITWDELYRLIPELDNEFFIHFYEDAISTEKRPQVNNYFRLILAKLYYDDDDHTQAKAYLDQILSDGLMDIEYEKLLLARTYELYATIMMDEENDAEANQYIQDMYRAYPQVAGLSGLPVTFYLDWEGEKDESILEELEGGNIQLVEQIDDQTRIVKIKSITSGSKNKVVTVSVQLPDGTVVVHQQGFTTDDEDAMAYSIFRALFGMALAEQGSQ